MAVSRLGIVGSGQMGGGVAEVAGQAGLEVLIHDVSEELCRRGVENIGRDLDRMVKRGRLKPEECERVLGRIKTYRAAGGLPRRRFRDRGGGRK